MEDSNLQERTGLHTDVTPVRPCFVWMIAIPVLLIPFLYSFQQLDPAMNVRYIGWPVMLLIMALVPCGVNGGMRVYRNPLVGLMLLFVLACGLSLWLLGRNPGDGWFEWGKVLMVFTGVCLIANYQFENASYPKHLSQAVMWMALLTGLFGLIQFVYLLIQEGFSHSVLYQVRSVFAHKNVFSEMMLVSLPFSAYAAWTGRGRARIPAVAALCVSLFLIIILLSRGAWIALAGGIIIMAIPTFLVVQHNRQKKIRITYAVFIRVMVILGASALFLFFVYSQFDTTSPFRKQVDSILNFGYGSTKDRLVLWENTLKVWKQSPVIGTGSGTWKIDILKYGTAGLKSADNLTFYQRPHNDYLWVLAENGIIAILVFLVTAGWVVYLLFQRIFQGLLSDSPTETPPSDKVFNLVVAAYLVFYGLLSVFAFPRERIEHLMLMSFVLAYLVIDSSSKKWPEINVRRLGRLIHGVMILALSGLICVGVTRYVSETHVRKAFIARENQDWKRVVQEIEEADGYFNRFDPMSTPLRWYSGMAHFNMKQNVAALADFERAWQISPWHQYVIANIGTCKEVLGDHDGAIRAFREAARLSPTYTDAWLNLAAAEFNRKNYSRAYEAMANIDTTCRDSRYMPFLMTICHNLVLSMQDSVKDIPGVARKLEAVSNTDNWMMGLHKKSLMNHISYQHQLIIDVAWVIRHDDLNDSVARMLEKRWK